MTMIHSARRLVGRTGRAGVGPQLAFAASVLMSFAAFATSIALLPRDLALPLTSTSFFVLAGAIAIIGWSRRQASEPRQVTYLDVAGALTLIGTFAASLMDPDQMVRVVEGTYREN
jgi:hypothetical protein